MKNKEHNIVIVAVLYSLGIQCISILFSCLIRLIFLLYQLSNSEVTFDLQYVLQSFSVGCRFDNMIVSYISMLPILIVTIASLFNVHPKKFSKFIEIWFGIIFGLIILLSVSDIRYYIFFEHHLVKDAFAWFVFPKSTFGMLFGDLVNLLFLLVAATLIAMYILAIVFYGKKIASLKMKPIKNRSYIFGIIGLIVFYGLFAIGLRGSLNLMPLNINNAYFCPVKLYNQLSINPIFNLEKSFEYNKEEIDFNKMDMSEAIVCVSNELNLQKQSEDVPVIFRNVDFADSINKMNVVIVFMESMKSENLTLSYKGKPLTPFLKQFKDTCSYTFSGFYSAGNHTNNGIVATLYGYTPDFSVPIMQSPSELYTGLPYYLQQNGYENIFFNSGEPGFDNVMEFMYDNSFSKVYSGYDMDAEFLSFWGVSDSALFDFSLKMLKNQKSPFLASILTVTNHTPYPKMPGYEDRGEDDEERDIAYADKCLERFMVSARNESWYDNTLFVLISDHGVHGKNPIPYDQSMTNNSTECYIYSSKFKGHTVLHIGSQIDIFPTIMGILKISYLNNTLGIDLMSEKRRYAFYVTDTHLCCSDNEYFYCLNIDSDNDYIYRIGDPTDLSSVMPEKKEDMRQYAISMFTVSQYGLRHKWMSPEK